MTQDGREELGRMNRFQIFEEENEALRERRDLCMERIAQIPKEDTVEEPYRDYFVRGAEWLSYLYRLQDEVMSGRFHSLSLTQKQERNRKLYEELLPGNYERSYANPDYCEKRFGKRSGKPLTVLAAELRSVIPGVFEGRYFPVVAVSELFIEIYNDYEERNEFTDKDVKRAIYYYAYDYAEEFLEYRTREMTDATLTFARDLIMESDLGKPDYLYEFGCYISENERTLAEYFAGMPEEEVQAMADTYVDGYVRGFSVMGMDFGKKSIVAIRYCIGFERMIRAAVRRFEAMGKRVVFFRVGDQLLTRKGGRRVGYHSVSPNPQYEYDHREDDALILDKALAERMEVSFRAAYEKYKIECNRYAGPAVLETFGSREPSPTNKASAVKPDKRQIRLKNEYRSRTARIAEEYMPSGEISYTIIAYPLPSVGERFPEIFDACKRVNNMDNDWFQSIQQRLIDALNTGEFCTVTGTAGNKTDMKIMLHPLSDPEKETNFENCTADVNIPAGEVFTSPMLTGTGGILHTAEVSLNGLPYRNLKIRFEDGMIAEYSCDNFEKEEENRSYLYENLLFRQESLPLGEFAIGTNTEAYAMGRRFGITDLLPILIAEKTGPHFAVGDTCYAHSEDHKVYNPDGREIIARDNEVSALRLTEPEKAYFHCHTDITIPYHEIGEIAVHRKDGTKIVLIQDGRFVLPGTEELNIPLDSLTSEA